MDLPETDLALETAFSHEQAVYKSGISASRTLTDSAQAVTLRAERVWTLPRAEKRRVALALSDAICELLPSGFDGSSAPVTVICLGNASLTPDSLGAMTADKILATRHLRQDDPTLFKAVGGREITVLKTGAAGETGIESAEIAKMCVESLGSALVLTVDALKASRPENLLSVIQVTGGVAPGSGVGSKRPKINRDTLGVPVISIGVPTVISAKSLLLATQNHTTIAPAAAQTEIFTPYRDFLVSSIECDIAVRGFSEIIASSINLTLLGDAAGLL